MTIRQAVPEDYDQILEIYQKLGFDYNLPGFESFEDIQIICDESGKIQMCLAAKKEISYYLLMDPECNLNPFNKWEYLKMIINNSFETLKKKGFNMVFCWVPPELEKSFGKRLMKLGGKKFTWPCFGREI